MPTKTGDRDPVEVVVHDLQFEFEGRLPDEIIVSLAEEEVSAFETAKVRDFVPVMAWRRARVRARWLVARGSDRTEPRPTS